MTQLLLLLYIKDNKIKINDVLREDRLFDFN
jgi:hypothetical protein